MIDEKLLDEAILEVAKERMGKELREAVIYGSPEMGKVYALYLDKVDADKAKKTKASDPEIHVLLWLLCLGICGFVLYDIYRMLTVTP